MLNLNDENITYGDIKDILKSNISNNMDIFNNAQVNLQLASMVNYKPILFPIIKSIVKHGITEIGGYQGNHLRELNILCEDMEINLHSVDPANKINQEKSTIFSKVDFYGKTSLEYLDLNKSHENDVYIIDGDHNYETVTMELSHLLSREKVSLIVLHDTGWPCNNIDTFYNVSNVKNEKEVEASYMNLSQNIQKLDLPFFWPIDYDINAEKDPNDSKNKSGVKIALNDLLINHSEWAECSIASIYGLTILYRTKFTQNNDFMELINKLDYFKGFLDILELNRLFLISQMHQQGVIWNENQAEIKRLNGIIEKMNSNKSNN